MKLKIFYLILGALILCVFGSFYFSCYSVTTVQGRNIDQWLKILRAKPNLDEHALKIVKVIEGKKIGITALEVPISYDSLQRYDLLGSDAMFGLINNGNERAFSRYCQRATNGYCLLGYESDDFSLGTNRIQIELLIFNPRNKDRTLSARGPVAEYVK